MKDSDRRLVAGLLALGGLVAAGLAFWQAKEAQGADLRAFIGGGGRGGDRTVMWLLIGAAALMLLGALLAWLSAGRTTSPAIAPLAPGWYDDPDSVTHLRYWDGVKWTDKRAAKSGDSP